MKAIYLDNAATTMIDAEVLSVMHAASLENYGNPSSTHQFGRKAKSAIETARKNIAKHFNVSASEIIFTSGGTEADNLILQNAVFNLGVQRIISSKIEHHAVLHTCEFLEKTNGIQLDFVQLDAQGNIDLQHLETLLATSDKKTLISLMLINNEIGNLLSTHEVCELSNKYEALFHSDAVQAVGHYKIDLQQTPIDFLVASAHKFHGPKGVGFAYFKKGFGIMPLFHGGNQEKGARSSTENVHGILGMEKALEIACKNLENDKKYINTIKKYFIDELQFHFKNCAFNGTSSDLNKSAYTILNVRFPIKNDLLLFSLDMAGIAVSGGSACQSGSNKGSHVLREILTHGEANETSIRFSFSKFTTKEEIDFTIVKLKELLK
ncbi:cysteine desulfurase family protein [Polaribacter gangjinensis]|uniref:cysteine desulfurase n=1 Tax=Polaribacter gangjinensis TaxID=574710 RepID=A0A2S7WA13_9FLAO|nr:cysteine desulfurase family protein [Polaribacter gangjinensis]PQJ74062.1 cysteine desulfurase [Polaribacter gangjinensis]